MRLTSRRGFEWPTQPGADVFDKPVPARVQLDITRAGNRALSIVSPEFQFTVPQYTREYRAHDDKPVVFPRQMCSHARPFPVLRMRAKAGPHRVQADVADGGDEMRIVHRHRSVASLEQMSCPSSSRIDEGRVAAMRFTHRPAEPLAEPGTKDQMNMVGHEAIRPDLDGMLSRLLSEHVAINILVTVFKEDRFPRRLPLCVT